jgi:flavin reductase (DIM6/NTAB) family NADH-FMN oxidoreductase RutF
MNFTFPNQTEFRTACSKFPTGVTVTTVLGLDGSPYGITISSFASVSVAPPLLLICIDRRSSILQHLAVGSYFGVNVLSQEQHNFSLQFSRNWSQRFAGVPWYSGNTGAPLICDVPAAFECRAIEQIPAGDHLIFIGEVLHVVSSELLPLTYVGRRYARIQHSELLEGDQKHS